MTFGIVLSNEIKPIFFIHDIVILLLSLKITFYIEILGENNIVFFTLTALLTFIWQLYLILSISKLK